MFYPLKDLNSLLFSKFPLESLNPSRSFLKFFIIFILSYSLRFFIYYFFLQHFRILVSGDCDFLSFLCYLIIFIEKNEIKS